MANKTLTASGETAGTKAGAAAFLSLLDSIQVINNATCVLEGYDGDARDYRSLAALIESSVQENLYSPGLPDDQREGYLRGLADLLSMVVDGAGPGRGWCPLSTTARAFGRATDASDPASLVVEQA